MPTYVGGHYIKEVLAHGACPTKLYRSRLSGSTDANANANADAAARLSTTSFAQSNDDDANGNANACASCSQAESHRYPPSHFLSANHVRRAAAEAEAGDGSRLLRCRSCTRLVHFARHHYSLLSEILMISL
jgi:hypothetical protein